MDQWIEQEDVATRWARDFHNKGTPPIRAMVHKSKTWVIQVFEVDTAKGTPWEGMLRVGICHYRRSGAQREIRLNWSVIQEIKSNFWPDQLAIEVYPSESEVVDACPMRWLWILPKGCRLPFTIIPGRESVG